MFGCQLEKVSSHTFNVQHNESVDIRAEYVSSSTSGAFYFCIWFQENGEYAIILKNARLQETTWL